MHPGQFRPFDDARKAFPLDNAETDPIPGRQLTDVILRARARDPLPAGPTAPAGSDPQLPDCVVIG